MWRQPESYCNSWSLFTILFFLKVSVCAVTKLGNKAVHCRIRSVWLCRFTVRTDRRMYPLSQYW
ncbi:hypothetical protein HMPREF9350_05721 [Escherichia coli MS 85-1]|uniref:Uncharacterized protein n=1 Tax=Escherichia coli MS 85-1 TaxID=679202 RepID=A0AAN3M4B3_ECOLX|nr:hypothetical protein HMPREF9350_05721 [Escherichia coli MS 85-1]